jgi:hypothetical protein
MVEHPGGQTGPGVVDQWVQQIVNARAHWELDSKLPSHKAPLTDRSTLELSVEMVEQEMTSSRDVGTELVLQTFIGQDKSFSTTPISRLQKS